MKEIQIPTAVESYKTQNGASLIIESWLRPIRNNQGRAIGFDENDSISTISLDIHGATSWKNPVLLTLEDLEDQTSSGAAYRSDFAQNLHLVLVALGANSASDLESLQNLVIRTRSTVLKTDPPLREKLCIPMTIENAAAALIS